MKMIVKLHLEPEIKEVFTGNNLEATKFDQTLRIKDGDQVLAEFDSYLYWVVDGFKGEPDRDILLMNLDYLDSFAEKLGPGLKEETLRWAIYTVKRYSEYNEIPGGPIDPNDPDWSWDKFKKSFIAAPVKN